MNYMFEKFNPFRGNPAEKMQKTELTAQKAIAREDIATRPTSDEQYLGEIQRERAELTRWQQDLTEELQLMVHRLKNERTDADGKWIRNQVFDSIDNKMVDAEPLCSDECIWRLIAMLEPSTSKNLMMSKYDKDSILNALLDLCNTVTTDVLIANRKRFKIRMSDLSPIMQIFKTAATPTYFRALGANEKEYLRGIRKDTYLHTTGDEKVKKGIMGL